MENQNVCKNCGGVKTRTTETQPPKGNVCKDCGQGVKSGEGHGHKKEG